VQNTLGLDPHSGLIVVFRSKRKDRLKILLWDGTGLVMIYKRLGDDGGFSGRRSATAFSNSPGFNSKRCLTGLNWKRVGEPSWPLRLRQTDSVRSILFIRRVA